MSAAEVTGSRLAEAMFTGGWEVVGERAGAHKLMAIVEGDTQRHHLLVPLDESAPDYMRRRCDALAAGDLEADDYTLPVEAVTWYQDLQHADIRAAAEEVAGVGRKVKVTLVVLVSESHGDLLGQLGGSDQLRQYAMEGRSVRLVNESGEVQR